MKTLSRNTRHIISHTISCIVLAAASLLANSAAAQGYTVYNLVANVHSVDDNTDTNLVNAWGMVVSKNTLTVNATETSLTGTYQKSGEPTGDYIAVDSEPTGLISNPTGGFKISSGNGKGKKSS